MGNEIRKISDVIEIERITSDTKMLAEENGYARRIPVDILTSLIKDTVTGTSVTLNDVSSIEHTLGLKIGGMTRKCANLIPYPYFHTSRTSNGITWTVNQDRSITVNGTATAQSEFYLFDKTSAFIGKEVSMCGGSSDCNLVAINYAGSNFTDVGNGKTFTPSGDIGLWLIVPSGKTINNQTFYPMLNYGPTTLPYEPYFEGLRSASATKVESVGANLFGGDVFYSSSCCA